ncbi:MAG: Holliday junction resolvase RuvX [Peptococcaceae bacterium]|nr:Holliday junction resolvase RuvX [Peptococcaceae bacterium]
MRIIGLDLGEKTIGVAISDPLALTAQGITVIKRSPKELEELERLIKEYEVTEIVIGLPRHMNGNLGDRALITQEFASLLEQTFQLPVTFWDERLSTIGAERVLLEADLSRAKRKKIIDKMAAVFILQGYLDSRKKFDNHYL